MTTIKETTIRKVYWSSTNRHGVTRTAVQVLISIGWDSANIEFNGIADYKHQLRVRYGHRYIRGVPIVNKSKILKKDESNYQAFVTLLAYPNGNWELSTIIPITGSSFSYSSEAKHLSFIECLDRIKHLNIDSNEEIEIIVGSDHFFYKNNEEDLVEMTLRYS